MAMSVLTRIWLNWYQYGSLEELEQSLLVFHDQYNCHIKTHWLAHASLFGCAFIEGSPKKIATQGWLWCAVIPVHSRNKLCCIIRDVVRNPA